ncbi:low molecular weight protein tyrosine phosphatase family protein [Neolewinella antarctica]|uniref:Protein-tyrosine phosphatase n=1 Tax=Neolewinella antarctica TaxID=442734 RepID=A0ABX0XE19_9BACT|nr:protein tyrosine phosphatase [Neolewinella antarctica]NJC27002.1 protein-tyrosine phosphatase [Neolewinella antarctica]
MNVLFLCSRNQWRSRTAEHIFRDVDGHCVKSAGTSPSARIRVGPALLNWAELIFVMEQKHLAILERKFPDAIIDKNIIALDVADDYRYLDEELIHELRDGVAVYL